VNEKRMYWMYNGYFFHYDVTWYAAFLFIRFTMFWKYADGSFSHPQCRPRQPSYVGIPHVIAVMPGPWACVDFIATSWSAAGPASSNLINILFSNSAAAYQNSKDILRTQQAITLGTVINV